MSLTISDAIQFAAVLPAGGLGKRMGAALPKQLLELADKPIWKYSLETFLAHPRIGHVVHELNLWADEQAPDAVVWKRNRRRRKM